MPALANPEAVMKREDTIAWYMGATGEYNVTANAGDLYDRYCLSLGSEGFDGRDIEWFNESDAAEFMDEVINNTNYNDVKDVVTVTRTQDLESAYANSQGFRLN